MDWMQSPQKWATQTAQLCDRGFAGDLVGGGACSDQADRDEPESVRTIGRHDLGQYSLFAHCQLGRQNPFSTQVTALALLSLKFAATRI